MYVAGAASPPQPLLKKYLGKGPRKGLCLVQHGPRLDTHGTSRQTRHGVGKKMRGQ